MKGSTITLIIALVVVIITGFLIFSNKSDEDLGQDLQETTQEENTQNNTQIENNTGEIIQNQPQTYNIEIKGFSFQPKELIIKVGDTIIWTNQDSTSHTATSDSRDELNSNLLSKGDTYSHTFTQTGTFPYHCRPHSSMKGKIIVE